MTVNDFLEKTTRQAREHGIRAAATAAARETAAKTVTRPYLRARERQAQRAHPSQRDRLRRLQARDAYLLLVFDAGRADVLGPLLEDAFETTAETTFSAARDTFEWVSTQWVGDGVGDVTYVSGMVPIAPEFPDFEAEGFEDLYATDTFVDELGTIVPVWDTDWNVSIGACPPEAVTDAALEYTDRDQLVVHYGQPHTPYIGTPQVLGYTESRSATPNRGAPTDRPIWERAQTGVLSDMELWLAYVGNAVRAVQSAIELVAAWDGPVVATADHGEALGEWGLYAHHRTPHPYRRLVPWAEITGIASRSVHDGDGGAIEDKLRALGYR